MRLEDATFVVTDTETTGLKPGGSRVIEIGAVKVVGGEIVDRYCTLVNPEHHVPRRITRITGITTPMVFAAPTASQVLPSFLDFLGTGIFVGHNVAFDKKFIQFEMRRAGIERSLGPALCTMRLARRLLHALPSKSLQSLKHHYGVRTARRHRALDDADATAQIFIRLLTALQNESGTETVSEVLRFQNQRLYADRTVPPNVRKIRDGVLNAVPNVPGVYLFKNASGLLIYVGKARDLHARVRTYFTGIDSHPFRIRQLVKAVRNIDFIPTASELSALILESRLIKRFKPTFNRAEVRYRNLPFLRLESAEHTKLEWSYEIRNDDAEYFGPLGNRREAERLVEIVGGVFGSQRESNNQVAARVRAFLTEGQEEVVEHLERAMQREADSLAFEQAAKFRDQLAFLEGMRKRRPALATPVLEHNAVWIHRNSSEDLNLYIVRYGRLAAEFALERDSWDARRGEVVDKLVQVFGPDAEAPVRYGKREIDEIRIIASWLFRVRESLAGVPFTVETSPEQLVAEVLTAVSGTFHQAGSGSESSISSGIATRSLQARSE